MAPISAKSPSRKLQEHIQETHEKKTPTKNTMDIKKRRGAFL
jgi:hypothetical protein